MKKEQISDIIDRTDEAYIREASAYNGKRAHRVRWGVIAACLAALMLGSATFAVAAEAKEYRAAVAFFEENGLSTDGLTRAEVKAVYRDITTQTFTYGKTAQVLRQTVSGYEITQREPTPEELTEIWNRNVWARSLPKSGIAYQYDYQWTKNPETGWETLSKSIVECYRNAERLWTAEFTEFFVSQSAYLNDATAVWGDDAGQSQTTEYHAWFARVDNDGNTVWKRRLNHGFNVETIAAVLNNGDGTWAVISRGDVRYLCLSEYDADGNQLRFNKTEIGNLGIWNAARLGDGYLVQIGNASTHDTAVVCRLDREGNIRERYTYQEDGCEYLITDMTEFGGQVYLSAYAVPKQVDGGGRHEIADILEYVFRKGSVTSEELTPLVRDNYTAVLLLCDSESGTPRRFYSVKGSLGGSLSVTEEGNLEWNVESIASTFFSPATSSFTVGGTCNVFRYTFAPSGALITQIDTGETTPYRR